MKVELIRYTEGPDELCGIAAATCTHSDDELRALRGAMSCGHDSVVEHASFTFRIEGVSRVLLAQLTRHRIASFSVESQRYVDQFDRACVIPPSMADDPQVIAFVRMAGRIYNILLKEGKNKEDARYILPMGSTTNLIMTMNGRQLRHFFSLRCCNRAQWEIRDMADQMMKVCKVVAPQIFNRSGPGCLYGVCPQGKRSCGKPRTKEEFDP